MSSAVPVRGGKDPRIREQCIGIYKDVKLWVWSWVPIICSIRIAEEPEVKERAEASSKGLRG